ncbi:MAG: S8 family peptidase [Anaerolineae bacterium]
MHSSRWPIFALVFGAFVLIAGLWWAAISLADAPAPGPRRALARPTPDWTAPHVPGQLLVKLADFSPDRAARFAATSGLKVRRTIPQLGIAVLEATDAPENPGRDRGDGPLAAIAAGLAASSEVEWVEPNYYTFVLDLIPNDPGYANQSLYLGTRLEMPAAWERTMGRPEVVIAIIDTGVDLNHADLAAGIWTNPLEISDNGLDDDGNGYVDDVHGWNFAQNNNQVADDYGHGTHVAGIAAARTNNGVGIAGMAGAATIMPIKVFPPPPNVIGTYEDLILGIIYAADNGARVINMSLGATSYSRGEEAAVDYAWARGAVVVAAAGNLGSNVYHYPAAHPNVIAVAATDGSDQRAGFSNWGDFVDVAAPGVYVFSTLRGNSYGWLSGTSMASPHVAGLAALILSANPQLSNAEVRRIIEQNADDLGTVGRDPYFGHGRINGRKALAAVGSPAQPGPTPTPSPPLSAWPAGCRDLITDGDFETGPGDWQLTGAWTIDATRAYSGVRAMHFVGGPGATGAFTRTLILTRETDHSATDPLGATLWFAFRIENQDRGMGSTPQMPFDDWLTAEFRTTDGKPIMSLLRTGNSADTASSGLLWDRYFYRLQVDDLLRLSAFGTVQLVFAAGNDADELPTDFWVDAVRFCAAGLPRRYYFPLFLNGGSP